VLSGAVARVSGEPGPGDTVEVADDGGTVIGVGFYAPSSPVRVRMLSRDPAASLDEAFFAERIRRAVAARVALGLPSGETDAYRLVHGDGDGLPGVAADRYGDHAVLQLTVRGMEDRRELLAGLLVEAAGLRGVRVNAVPAFANSESLARFEGDLGPEPVPEEIPILENRIRFLVDPVRGQKTGHFADHRENRARFGAAAGRGEVLDAFCGTGGFALAAALGGADRVVAVDSSPEALDRARRNAEANGVADRIETVRGDVFRTLRKLEREGRRFDAVCLDPPRLASRRKELRGALRGYKELNLRALRLVREGGVLATASCTGILAEEAFLRVLRDAALDAKRHFTVFHAGGQGPDHPWSPVAPESRYLKFLLGRVGEGVRS
jgi:23S rRNA (cytosine1962-C5)-methyltransferase